MAQRVQVILEDDVDGGKASETIRFGLDGVDYEIDLSDKNAGKLRDGLAVWVSHSRRTGGRRRAGGAASTLASRSRAKDIRAWAQQKGLEISARGRIPAEVQEQYDRVH